MNKQKLYDDWAKTSARYAKISAALLELKEPLSKNDLGDFLKGLKSSVGDLADTIFMMQDSNSLILVNKLGSDVIIKLFNTYVEENPQKRNEILEQILTAIQDPSVREDVKNKIQPAPITTENSSAGMKVINVNSEPQASKPTGVKSNASRPSTPIQDPEKGGEVINVNKRLLFEKVRAFEKNYDTFNTDNLSKFLEELKITKNDFFEFMLSKDGLSFVNKLSPDLISELISKAGDKKSRELAFNKLIVKNLIDDDDLKSILSDDNNIDLWVVLWKDNFDKFSKVFDKFRLFERQKILLTNFDAFIELIKTDNSYKKRGLVSQIKDEASINIIGETLNFEQMLMKNDKTNEIVNFLKLISMSIHLEKIFKEYVNEIKNLTAKNLILQMLKDGLQNDPQAEYLTKIFLKKLGLQDNQLNEALEQLKKFPKSKQYLYNINNFISAKEQDAQPNARQIVAPATAPKDPEIFGDEGSGHQFD